MLSFSQFCCEEKYYYHGTSSHFVDDIKKNGLKPNSDNKLYVTPSKKLAAIEAHNTVHGDYGGDKRLQSSSAKMGVGGHPVVVKIKKEHAKNLTPDAEYPPEEKAFHTSTPIEKHGIHSFHNMHKKTPEWIKSYWRGD